MQLWLRRVIVFNAWGFTTDGICSEGLEAGLAKRTETKKPGIGTQTLGVIEGCEKGLENLSTSKSYVGTGSVKEVLNLMADTTRKADLRLDVNLSLNPPAVLKIKRENHSKVGE